MLLVIKLVFLEGKNLYYKIRFLYVFKNILIFFIKVCIDVLLVVDWICIYVWFYMDFMWILVLYVELCGLNIYINIVLYSIMWIYEKFCDLIIFDF